MKPTRRLWTIASFLALGAAVAPAQRANVEVSEDGQLLVQVQATPATGAVTARSRAVPYGTIPDWENALRMQVGGLEVGDLNNDGWNDVAVGCYHSQSYPPYDDWRNLIYFNTGLGQLQASPGWISTDERSTTDIKLADFNRDGYLDVFAANGDFTLDPSAIYWGGATGPSTTPGWLSTVPGGAWAVHAIAFDFDHDGDLDIVTANQGNSQPDPYRPMWGFTNNSGTIPTTPTWQSSESSIQNFLAAADWDGDGWEDLAVSKWSNFQTGIYRNVNGLLAPAPAWTVGSTGSDKGVGWGDFDDNGWPDLAVGRNPTQIYGNDNGALSIVWSAVGTYFGHNDLRVVDVNRDGYPDLAECHFSNGKVQIYLNNNGVLDAAPTWTYDSPTVGTAIAFGDLNNDCWPDLVVGNSGQPCVKVFLSRPPAAGDLDDDGDVDAADFGTFEDCYTTVGVPARAGCGQADLDCDTDIDLTDFAAFQVAFTG